MSQSFCCGRVSAIITAVRPRLREGRRLSIRNNNEGSSAMRFALAAVLVAAQSVSALAADVPATSSVDAVTVFLSGAEVTRLAKVKLDKGENTIILGDVPASAVPGSIRVEDPAPDGGLCKKPAARRPGGAPSRNAMTPSVKPPRRRSGGRCQCRKRANPTKTTRTGRATAGAPAPG